MALIDLNPKRSFNNKLGSYIKWKHTTTGISQKIASQYLGISQQAYSKKLKKVSFKPHEVNLLFKLFGADELDVLKMYGFKKE